MLSIFTQIMPILLAENGFNYEQQGYFSLVAYPFFFKIIFAPLVDLFHIKKLGRRKSYILPCTILMSINLYIQSSLDIKNNYHLFCLIGFFNATFLGFQDIAIDGFATDLCKKTNESSAHILNIGYTIGSSFLANFVFNTLNKYQLCSLSTYLKFVALFGILQALYLYLKVQETEQQIQVKKFTGFRQVISGIFKNDNLMTLSLLLFFDRYGVAPIEASFRIKLTEFKFNKAYVSFLDTAIMPLKIAVGFVYHKYFNQYNFEYYGYVQGLRLLSCFFAALLVFLVDVVQVNDTLSYVALLIANVTWWIVFNLTFIVKGNFQMKITTPGYEATTLALMNSLGSLGGKTAFSLSLIITEYVNYYYFALFSLIVQALFTIKSIGLYKKLYKIPTEKWYITQKQE